MDLQDFKSNRINSSMLGYDADLLIASTPANIFYLLGYKSAIWKVAPHVQMFCVYDIDANELAVILPAAEVPSFRAHNIDARIYSYGEFYFASDSGCNNYATVYAALSYAVQGCGSKIKNIAVDNALAFAGILAHLENISKSYSCVLMANIFGQIRAVKHKSEIAAISMAAKIAEQSFAAVVANLKVGLTEEDVYRRYLTEIIRRGAEPSFCVVSAGLRSAYADTGATKKIIDPNTIIRFDFGCEFDGYHADIARTVIIGNCPIKARNYYAAILAGEQQAIAAIRPGVVASELFTLAVNETCRTISHYKRHHCGHGIGLEPNESLLVAPASEAVLEEGMVICIETPYYELGWGGIQVEDMLLVTADGCEYLSHGCRELIIL